MYPAAAALLLQFSTNVAVDERIKDEPRPPFNIVQDSVQMAFGADHRPEMAQRLDVVELRKAGLGDHLQGLAGGVRKEMQVELAQGAWLSAGRTQVLRFAGITARENALWKSLSTFGAELSGRLG